MRTFNVQCAYPDCENPVIGQCGGYPSDKKCGKFYCSEHTYKDYCLKCGEVLKNKELVVEYSEIAENLNNASKAEALPYWGLSFVFIAIGGGLLFSKNETGICFGVVFIIGVFWALVKYFQKINQLNAAGSLKIQEENPGFAYFFEEWKKEKDKQALMGVLLVTGVAAIIITGAASKSQDQQTQDDIRDIRNKIDRM